MILLVCVFEVFVFNGLDIVILVAMHSKLCHCDCNFENDWQKSHRKNISQRTSHSTSKNGVTRGCQKIIRACVERNIVSDYVSPRNCIPFLIHSIKFGKILTKKPIEIPAKVKRENERVITLKFFIIHASAIK